MAEWAAGDSRLIAGRYRLEARIGKGGIGEVWRARHLTLNSFVAIKFLQGASAQNEATRRRFTTEAQVTAQLKSQHAVQVFDFGVTEDGHPYLIMELLEGETLGRRLEREGRIDILDTARLLGQSARALHRAHQLGIVHRDFKPDNIVIGADDEGRDYVKVVDFGLAKLVGDLDGPASSDVPEPLTAPPTATFTKTGAMLGTPFYMAPEQVRSAANVDLRADIWAFGVVAFECLTGCTPFGGETLFELFQNIENGKHPDADKLEPSVPPGFQEWFETACAPDPTKRFPDAMTAWKRLLVALECGKVDVDPSLARGRALSSSGERLVGGDGSPMAADGSAVTLDVSSRGVLEQRRAPPVGPAGIRPRASAASESVGREPHALAQTIAADAAAAGRDLEITQPRKRPGVQRRKTARRAILVAIALLAVPAAALWRGGSSAPPPASADRGTSSIASPPAPSARPIAGPVQPIADSPPTPTSPVPLAAPSTAKTLSSRPRLRTTSAASAVSASAPATQPPPAATAPPPRPSGEPSDPGSYR